MKNPFSILSMRGERGYSLVELMCACFILAIIAGSLVLFIRAFFLFFTKDNSELSLMSQRARISLSIDNDLRASAEAEPQGIGKYKLTLLDGETVYYSLDNGELKRTRLKLDSSWDMTVLADKVAAFSLVSNGAPGSFKYIFYFQKEPDRLIQETLVQPR